MKVLFVSSGNSDNGISPIVKSQGEALKMEGIDVEYFTISGKGPGGYYKSISRLRKALSLQNYDLIHAHYGFCGIVSHFARTKEKLIVSFMGEDLLASYNSRGSITLKSRLFVAMNRFFARWYDSIIVKSREMHKVLNFSTKATVVPNGVNLEVFMPLDKVRARYQLGIPVDVSLVIFVANPERSEKNFKLAQQAFNSLEIEPKELRPLYKIPQEELPLYYSAADALLLTSLHEGSPNVVKEALACNCPVISTDVGDVREIIDPIDGCFLTSFDAKEITEALKRVLKSGIRIDGKGIIQEKLDSRLISRKIISIYQQLLAG